MDFFDHQDRARKKTGRLVALFFLAVLGIIALVYFAAVFAFHGSQRGPEAAEPLSLFQPGLLLGSAGAVCAVVAIGSLYKLALLRGGGRVVAESLGGRRLEPGSGEPHERRLLNVVEEMSIASGTPVPAVYLLEHEDGINAFAAGFTPSDAVIGITRGCSEKLSRDELQGVVAHEFSHVFNGDMRLNLRLMGVLHGILILGLIGQFVLRSSLYSGVAGRSRRREGGGGSAMPILAFGAALAAIGWIGTLFGNMIQAAVSRQREFLADASAVQFTRNPSGISGALRKIGGLSRGSRLVRANASEVSHMLFGSGLRRGLSSVFATHPPLKERIRRIEPGFDGRFPEVPDDFESPFVDGGEYASLAGAPVSRRAAERAETARAAEVAEGAERRAALRLVGEPTPQHLERARDLLGGLPEPVRAAAHEPFGARAVVYGLLLDERPEVRRRQLEQLEQSADPQVFAATTALLPHLGDVERPARLPLVDVALPALRELSPRQHEAFSANVGALVRADGRMDPFEWTLQRLLLRHLAATFTDARPRPAQYYSLARLSEPVSVLLSTFARMGHDDEERARTAFEAGARRLPNALAEWLPRERCGLVDLGRALDALDTVSPPLKRDLLAACGTTIAHDHEVTVLEAEVFRAAADSLGAPIPPLLPGQALVA